MGARAALARWRRRRRPPAAGKLVGMMATRNEAWVLGLTLRAALEYCDSVVVADHGSADATEHILAAVRAEFPARELDVWAVDSPEWNEMDVRERMLKRGRELGGTHFAIVDADELPTANLLARLRRWALGTRPGEFHSLPMVAPYLALDVRRHDGAWGATSRIPWCFADAPDLHYAVPGAHQLHRRVPQHARDAGALVGARSGGIFHLQFADERRLAAKAAWYKMIETLRYPGRRAPAELNAIYDWTLDRRGARLGAIPAAWWQGYEERGWMRYLQPSAPAWQAAEIERLLAEHGPAPFSGVDLHRP